MKERPILFSAPMVRAILSGTKTQTRRVVKPQPDDIFSSFDGKNRWPMFLGKGMKCPYGQPGDRLWVRETFCEVLGGPPFGFIAYRSDKETITVESPEGVTESFPKWRPSIFMPRCASRITPEVTAVRVERLQDISKKDALAEGCGVTRCERCDESGDSNGEVCEDCNGSGWHSEIDNYRSLWESINGHGSWYANPLVWVIEFKRID